MNYRKIRRNVKAISPVISVLLMIAVAVAASLVTYAWVMGYLGFTTNKVGKAIQIQSVANETQTTHKNLVVYVQNVGEGAVKFTSDSLYVDGTLQTPLAPSDSTLQPGETAFWTVIDYLNGKDVPLTVSVKVATEDGTFMEATKTFG